MMWCADKTVNCMTNHSMSAVESVLQIQIILLISQSKHRYIAYTLKLFAYLDQFCLVICFEALHPSQQLWSCRDGRFT